MRFKRLPQLRVTVNSRCGRHCFFCRPSGEALPTPANHELEPAVLIELARAFGQLGLRQMKLTGGDPALWEPLVETVPRLKHEAGLQKLEVISRHPRIGVLADALARGGVDLFNISIDSLLPKVHHEITGVDDLPAVLRALDQCVDTGVPVKVNTVVMAGVNDHELEDLIAYCEGRRVGTLKLLDVIRDLGEGFESYARRLHHLRKKNLSDLYQPLGHLADRLRERAVEVRVLHQGGLGHPMTSFHLPSGLQVVLKDHHAGAWYGSICEDCRFYPCHDALMALRVTADLRLQYCLLREDVAVDLKPHLAAGSDALNSALSAALAVYDSASFSGPGVSPKRSGARELPVLR